MSHVTLLGPQRFRPAVADTLASLGVTGQVATVTAGWQEREPDDDELQELLGGRGVNLLLYGRWLDLMARDAEFATAHRRRRDTLEELQSLYLLRLHYAMQAVYELGRRAGDAQVAEAEIADAITAVQALDARHLERVAEVHADFSGAWPVQDRPVLAEHRDAVAAALGGVDAVAIAGGHVAVLLACLELFDVAPAIGDRPVVAWSAGAMAVAEVVVLFHDRAVHSPGHAEVHGRGLGLCTGVVPLPHARHRLRVDDRRRMGVLARRFAPRTCVLLDAGARLDCPGGACDAAAGVTVRSDGRLHRGAA